KTASPTTPVAFDPTPVSTGPGPNSATAIQPPGTVAALAAIQAKTPGAAAAYAPDNSGEALPTGEVKANGKPVPLHSETTAAPRRRGAKIAAKPPEEEVTAPAKPGKRGKGATAAK